MEQEKDMASLKDISKICGVSVATVSKALNDHKDIGEETKANIRRVFPEPFRKSFEDEQDLRHRSSLRRRARSGLTHDYFSSVLDSFKRTAEKSVTTLHSLIAARTGRIGCPTWNTAGTEASTEWCSPVLISGIPKSSN